ncbi:MAG: endolytic transglycosylase MltG [Treponema sp.]|nr:endolytic transglycosylase MltG [Treponema sp.]
MPKLPLGLRILFILISSLIAGVLLLGAGLAGAALYLNAPPKERPLPRGNYAGAKLEEGGTILFEVREGESAKQVGRRLEQAGLIKNRLFWDMLSRFEKEYLKAGTYRLVIPASQTEIRSILVEGQQVLLRVTIPEGVTLKKAAAIMGQSGICNAEDFLLAAADRNIIQGYRIPGETMEGYLYPETYFFPGSFPAERVIRTMADTFFARVREIASESETLSPGELYDTVILASIVEREYRVADEAPIMAGVFYNRIKINMSLESCATVQYVITEIQGKPHPHVLYYADIEIKDPYNTYVYPGLPPGPISFPGRVALSAAFHPAQTDYLFFRLVDEAAGRHYFSKTLDAHIRAGALFVKG